MISVIIPVYNQATNLSWCLNGLLKQTYKNLEIIVVNDGSTDDSLAKAQEYKPIFKKQEIPYSVFSQSKKGAPSARNQGRKYGRGNYLLFCDADAHLVPEGLSEMAKTLKKHLEASFVYSNFKWGRKLFKLFPFDKDRLRQMPYIHTISLVRARDFPSRGWDEDIKKLQDWDLWLTMVDQGFKGVWLDKTLFYVRTGGVYSSWLPSIAYKLLPFLPQVKKYKKAMRIVKDKHGIKN